MSSDAMMSLAYPTVRCPRCGYDQRGLPAGRCCPECGARFYPGAVLAEVNQWVDRTVLNLWSICAMQSVGGVCLLLGLIGLASGQASGIIIMSAAGLYVITATVWFLSTALIVALRRARPAYLNITDRRRADLTRWLLIDALVCGLPPLLAWVLMRR